MKSYLWLHKHEDEWRLMSWQGKVLTTQTFNMCADDMPKILASNYVPLLDFDEHVRNQVADVTSNA